MENSSYKVCVTRGYGFVGSWLIKKLLDKGFTIHTTLRPNLEKFKVDFVKNLPNADTRLVLFEAEIYNPDTFEKAIQGCEFVVHVATAVQHTEGYHFKNIIEACVAAAKKIVTYCVQSGTVKRLIYTSTLTCGSPLKEEEEINAYKDLMDETCWTPLDHPITSSTGYLKEYIKSKMKSEKEIMSIGKNNNLDVVAWSWAW